VIRNLFWKRRYVTFYGTMPSLRGDIGPRVSEHSTSGFSPFRKRNRFSSYFPVLAVVQLQHAESKGRWVLNMHIIFDESAPSSPLVGSAEPRSTHPAMRCKPRLGKICLTGAEVWNGRSFYVFTLSKCMGSQNHVCPLITSQTELTAERSSRYRIHSTSAHAEFQTPVPSPTPVHFSSLLQARCTDVHLSSCCQTWCLVSFKIPSYVTRAEPMIPAKLSQHGVNRQTNPASRRDMIPSLVFHAAPLASGGYRKLRRHDRRVDIGL
jgi:hypothetical protein